MSGYKFKPVNFDQPSFLFRLEDKLKTLIGGPILYNSYFKSWGLKGSEKILDFGCGGGTEVKCLLKFLNDQNQVTCLDTSNYWMKKAEKRLKKYPTVECKVGDIKKLDILDYSFDIISIIHVIHDIEPSERQEIILALTKKLKAKGTLFIREPIKITHGMPIVEIQTLMLNAGLKETQNKALEC